MLFRSNLNWCKEQTKISSNILSEDVVRLSSLPKKVSTYYVSPVQLDDDFFQWDECEEFKSSTSIKEETPINFELYCECGNICKNDQSLCKSCLEKQTTIEFSGYLSIFTKDHLKRYWVRLLNKELYCIFQ